MSTKKNKMAYRQSTYAEIKQTNTKKYHSTTIHSGMYILPKMDQTVNVNIYKDK